MHTTPLTDPSIGNQPRPPLPPTGETDRALREIGLTVLGPFVCAYVDWVVERAQRRGLTQLHFLSRDAQIMHKVARIRHPNAITARYFHVSRFAVRTATFRPAAPLPNWLLFQPDRTVGGLCCQLGIEPEAHAGYLAGLGFPPGEWRMTLPWPRYRRLVTAFVAPANEAFWRLIAPRRQLLLDYLLQENIRPGERTAFVDTGWLASTQLTLSGLMKQARMETDISGYYLGLNAKVPKAEAWVFDLRNPEHWLAGYTALLELLMAGDHAMVVGYERQGDRIVPRLNPQSNPVSPGVSVLHEAVCEYARALKPVPADRAMHDLRQFIWRPTEPQARAFAPVTFTSWQILRTEGSTVPRLSFRAALKVAFSTRRCVLEIPWPQASVVLSFPVGMRRRLLRALLRVKEMRDIVRVLNDKWPRAQGHQGLHPRWPQSFPAPVI